MGLSIVETLKETVRELKVKIDKLCINTSTRRKETLQEKIKQEGDFMYGDVVELKTKA